MSEAGSVNVGSQTQGGFEKRPQGLWTFDCLTLDFRQFI